MPAVMACANNGDSASCRWRMKAGAMARTIEAQVIGVLSLARMVFAWMFCLVSNDTGRLGKSEIDRMVADAEKYREEDRKVQERSAAKAKVIANNTI